MIKKMIKDITKHLKITDRLIQENTENVENVGSIHKLADDILKHLTALQDKNKLGELNQEIRSSLIHLFAYLYVYESMRIASSYARKNTDLDATNFVVLVSVLNTSPERKELYYDDSFRLAVDQIREICKETTLANLTNIVNVYNMLIRRREK